LAYTMFVARIVTMDLRKVFEALTGNGHEPFQNLEPQEEVEI
jgi:hypothetical protein